MFNKNLIINLIEQKGWSRYKLCKEAHLAQSTLSDILSGKNINPRMDTIQKIADALGVSVNDFFDDESQTENQKTDKSIKKDLHIIPKEFTNPDEARQYINKHQIFGSNGFDSNKLDDDEILEFANELLKQMELISFKFKK